MEKIRLQMRRPAFFVFASPQLHGFRIALDVPVAWIELQFALNFPRNVGQLQHGDGNIANRDGSVELISLANGRDEIRKVRIGHGVETAKVAGRRCLSDLAFTGLYALQVVNFVAARIDYDRTGSPHDDRSAITIIDLHPLAASAFPTDHLVAEVKVG